MGHSRSQRSLRPSAVFSAVRRSYAPPRMAKRSSARRSRAKRRPCRSRTFGLLWIETSSVRADRKIAQPKIGKAPFFPQFEQRPIECQSHRIVAAPHRDSDALTKIPAFGEWPTDKSAAAVRIAAIQPERKRNPVAEQEIDVRAP